MKRLLKIIEDNGIQIIEIITSIFVLIIPKIFNIKGMFSDYLKANIIEPDNVFYILLLGSSNVVIGIVLCVIVLRIFRKYNHDSVMMNRVNTYHSYPYWWFWFSAKVLNIRKCNLKKVPQYMQTKIVVNELFDDFPIDDNDYPEDNAEVKLERKNFRNGNIPKEINLVIEDTYPIEYRQLPRLKASLPTIRVYRERGNDLSRHYSPELIKTVSSELRQLPEGITVNIFATLNPKNMLYIARNALAMAERGNVKHLYVFQQKSIDGRHFNDNGKKIY